MSKRAPIVLRLALTSLRRCPRGVLAQQRPLRLPGHVVVVECHRWRRCRSVRNLDPCSGLLDLSCDSSPTLSFDDSRSARAVRPRAMIRGTVTRLSPVVRDQVWPTIGRVPPPLCWPEPLRFSLGASQLGGKYEVRRCDGPPTSCGQPGARNDKRDPPA
ncbi:uncharacterized protein PFL1_04331 [Pseudozyma flocculosa PF-1]|uniref:Uncharacterized protein n=1 Tax=Pseudozyma flocculosa PF-1 TaxID=1277687 RepID=A0A061H6E2_9BASI|nr:uncharacterized protein PFL1_04331 [Pseudozyma flocculosa PF-1]EPQ28004.1 hypothetical protein PFL1_04331 [Pseudozyma flocculosa PF-1]